MIKTIKKGDAHDKTLRWNIGNWYMLIVKKINHENVRYKIC